MDLSNEKILLADDSMLTRKIMKEILYGFGFRLITECIDGREAMEYLANGRYKMIISDWHMPRKSGLDLLKHVREELKERKKDLPFIMVTSDGEKEQVISALELGVSDYIVKPFTQEIVRNKLKAYYPSLAVSS